MQLNPDCIRDLLIEIESETTDVDVTICFDPEKPRTGPLAAYGFDEIAYHLKQCSMSG